ncbi:hypothetical protein PsorP6_012775 [Peronosclerospora sorghi]|uniref:Uncharacterized protein n=1 Tax=Peronosclerospora sorghi TaxID=230839 RepID=A0ACC0WIU9_9STRA|nr:hypothetical protein PsorP6_012775 [Peronosclerospora sorghi]
MLYVNDILVGCARYENAEKVGDELSARFTLKSLGDARFVLGMEVKYDMEKGELILKQEKFITKMLQNFGCNDAHATRNPMVLGQDLVPTDGHDVFDDKTKYRELGGSLLYVANATRPDRASILVIHFPIYAAINKYTSKSSILLKIESSNVVAERRKAFLFLTSSDILILKDILMYSRAWPNTSNSSSEWCELKYHQASLAERHAIVGIDVSVDFYTIRKYNIYMPHVIFESLPRQNS